MENLNKKQKIILISTLVIMVIFIGYYIIKKTNNAKYINLEVEENELEISDNKENKLINEEEKSQNEIIVHVIGAVKEGGIIKLNEGARISDVIEAAGGITDDADLSKVNLAYIVEDGQKIYIPNINDKEVTTNVTKEAGDGVIKENGIQSLKKININKASQTELETLNGIGTSTALKVIKYREEHGKFKNIEDIKNVSGIGDAKFEAIKDDICI